jgi:hypothetical protein
MNTFIFNANKTALSPQKNKRTGKIKKDRYGNPLCSIRVVFDTPEMKKEALKRMKDICLFYKQAPHMFPEMLQSGLDPQAEPMSDVIQDLEDKIEDWSKGADIFEAFITRCNDLVDYVKADQTDPQFAQILEVEHAIRITPRKRVKILPRTNLADLIDG